jgi:hypothetical protein
MRLAGEQGTLLELKLLLLAKAFLHRTEIALLFSGRMKIRGVILVQAQRAFWQPCLW